MLSAGGLPAYDSLHVAEPRALNAPLQVIHLLMQVQGGSALLLRLLPAGGEGRRRALRGDEGVAYWAGAQALLGVSVTPGPAFAAERAFRGQY